jgi:hypothetical protein
MELKERSLLIGREPLTRDSSLKSTLHITSQLKSLNITLGLRHLGLQHLGLMDPMCIQYGLLLVKILIYLHEVA